MVQANESVVKKPAIEVTGLHFSYSNDDKPFLTLPHWNVQQGQKLFIQGPSGCGKSTLLNLLTGVLVPNSGDIKVLGHSLQYMSSHQRDRFRAKHIGVVFQQFNLIPYLSVLDNIRLAVHFADRHLTPLEGRVKTLFEKLRVPEALLSRRADRLSVGQQQRVAIVRALINDPEILVVDEPTSALDSDATDAFMQILLGLCQEKGCALVFVSHDKSLAHYFDSSVCLKAICELGVPDAD